MAAMARSRTDVGYPGLRRFGNHYHLWKDSDNVEDKVDFHLPIVILLNYLESLLAET